ASDMPLSEAGLVAEWRFDDLSSAGVTTASVGGFDLTVKHAVGSGFTAGSIELTAAVSESATTGTFVGTVYGSDIEREAKISSLLAADSSLRYSAETGKFYKLVTSSGTWSSAMSGASGTSLSGVAGELATIHSASENAFVASLNGGNSSWLGAADSVTEGTWRWYSGNSADDVFWSGTSSGTAVDGSYENFASSQPDDSGGAQDYLSMNASGAWDDIDGSSSLASYIVQWDADAVLDATNPVTYSIVSQSVAGAFAIDSDSGAITVADGTLLDFESQPSHTLTVRISDGTNTFDAAFTIDLKDAVESPAAPADLTAGISLNTDGGNSSYLVTNNGGAILGGCTSLTVEVIASFSSETSGDSCLVSYAVPAGSDDEVLLRVSSSGTLSLSINGAASSSSGTFPQLLDGQPHSIAATWDNTNGDVRFYIDGELVESTTSLKAGVTLAGGGTLVVGQDQDSVDGGFDANQSFAGTLYDVRLWSDARSPEEIALNHQRLMTSAPSQLLADWKMTGFDGSNQVIDSVSGNNLSLATASGAGFTASSPTTTWTVAEDSGAGTVVGAVSGTSSQYSSDIVADGLFREGADPGSLLQLSAGQTFGAWTVGSGNVDYLGTFSESSPLGGRAVDLNGSTAGSIYQNLATVAGRHYQVIFAMSGNFGGGESIKDLRVSAAGQSQDFSMAQPAGWSNSNMLWNGRSFEFTAESASTKLSFASLDAANSYGACIADIRVVEIPDAVQRILSADASLSYDAGTGKFYRSVRANASWSTAQASANNDLLNGVAGDLVAIGSEYENTLVWSMARALGDDVWLAASDATTEGTWNWNSAAAGDRTFYSSATGLAAGSFANWSPGEPNDSGSNEDYAQLYVDTGKWNDMAETSQMSFIVQWDASEVLGNLSYSLSDDAGGAFAIDTDTGQVTVADSSALDYEAASAMNITILVTDAGGATYSETMSIALTDVDEFDASAISDSDATADTVAENAAVGTAVGIAASASDADATNNTISYTLVDDDGGRFAIDSATGVVTVAGAIDREADGASRTIIVRASSTDGSTSDRSFTIAISDVNEAATSAISDSDATADTVAENAAVGTAVGIAASASDADATNNTISYTLVDDDGGR
ncbi:MAG: cadherin domain-containing protein, partial [Aureliella sp.]